MKKVLCILIALFMLTSCTLVEKPVPEVRYSAEEIVQGLHEKYFDGKRYLPKNLAAYLILGVDLTSNTSAGPNLLLILLADKNSRTYSFLQINPNTMAKVDELGAGGVVLRSEYLPVSTAYTFGKDERESGNLTEKAVIRLLLDAPLSGYVSLSKTGLINLMDFIAPDGLKVSINGETTYYSSEDALNYIYEIEDNYLRHKLITESFISSLPAGELTTNYWLDHAYETVYKVLYSDINQYEIYDILDYMAKYSYIGKFQTLDLDENNFSISSSLENLVKENFYEEH